MVGVDEGLTDAQRGAARRLQMNRHEGAWGGPGAGQEQRLALLDEAVVAVAQRVGAQVGPVVSNANRNGGLLSIGCIGASKWLLQRGLV